FVMCLNLFALFVAVALDWWAASRFGLAGAAVGSVTVIYLDRLVTLWRIGKLANLPLRRLQEWRPLGERLLFAVVARALARTLVGQYFAASATIVHLAVGGVVVAAAYATMAELLGTGSGLLAVRGPVREP